MQNIKEEVWENEFEVIGVEIKYKINIEFFIIEHEIIKTQFPEKAAHHPIRR